MALLQISEPNQSSAPHQRRLAAGIDLGTTNSLIASVRNGVPEALPDAQGNPLLPSVVHYSANAEPVVDWGLAVELPKRVLADLYRTAKVCIVAVRNGVVIEAPGELNSGRTTRLANPAQRRALRGLYATCAVPGCRVQYSRLKLHHVIWWEHGGTSDLANFLPICERHHQKIHHRGWLVSLGPNRQLTIRLPDGQIMTTGPPKRDAA